MIIILSLSLSGTWEHVYDSLPIEQTTYFLNYIFFFKEVVNENNFESTIDLSIENTTPSAMLYE